MKSELACFLVRDRFGEEFERVCRVLGASPGLGVEELVKQSEIAYPRLREILVVLYAEHYVLAPALTFDAGAALSSLAYPVFHRIFQQTVSPLAARISELLFKYGSVTLRLCLEVFEICRSSTATSRTASRPSPR